MFWRSMALKQYYQHPLSLSPPPHHACLWPAQIGYLYPLECTERSERFWGGHRPSTRHTTVNVLRSALQGLWIIDMIINSHSRIVDNASLKLGFLHLFKRITYPFLYFSKEKWTFHVDVNAWSIKRQSLFHCDRLQNDIYTWHDSGLWLSWTWDTKSQYNLLYIFLTGYFCTGI